MAVDACEDGAFQAEGARKALEKGAARLGVAGGGLDGGVAQRERHLRELHGRGEAGGLNLGRVGWSRQKDEVARDLDVARRHVAREMPEEVCDACRADVRGAGGREAVVDLLDRVLDVLHAARARVGTRREM